MVIFGIYPQPLLNNLFNSQSEESLGTKGACFGQRMKCWAAININKDYLESCKAALVEYKQNVQLVRSG